MSVSGTYPKTMKAVFPEKPGGRLVVRETSVPEPGPNEVLVRISVAPVNPSDLAAIKIALADGDVSSFIPGLEGSGTIVAAGSGLLPLLWKGRRVACSPVHNTSGTWAEYMVTKAGMCFPLSAKVSDEQGSMSLVNPLTALAFFEIAEKNNHKAVINNAAASSLGRMVELIGSKKGIPVINIVRNQSQALRLKEMGSHYVLDSSSPRYIDELGVLSGKLNATVLFDSVCSKQLQKMTEVLPYGSTVIIYGNLSGEELIMFNPRDLIRNGISVKGFYLARQAKENGMIKNLLNLSKVSRLMKSGMTIKISGKYPLDRVQEAVDNYLAGMSAGKVLLVTGR